MSDDKFQDYQTSGSGEKKHFLPFMSVVAILVMSSIGCHLGGCFSDIHRGVTLRLGYTGLADQTLGFFSVVF